MDSVDRIRMKFEVLAPVMNERLTRLWGGRSRALRARRQLGGHAGDRDPGQEDLAKEGPGALRENPPTEPARGQRMRKPGAGRKRLEDVQPKLVKALDALIDPSTRGGPECPCGGPARARAGWPRN